MRDTLLGHPFLGADADIDCTTDARPTEVLQIVETAASSVWTQGRRFGTIGCVLEEQAFEITTHRADSYDPASRKPAVAFGTDVSEDLHRRDFTVNAIAVDAADGRLIDPCGGRRDLRLGLLRTPLDPAVSFAEDPLRMLRAARFVAGHHLEPDQAMTEAITAMEERLSIVSKERIRDEFHKLLMLDDPTTGLGFLAVTGLLAHVLPEHAARSVGRIARRAAAGARRSGSAWHAVRAGDGSPSMSAGDGSVMSSSGTGSISQGLAVAAVDRCLELRWAALLAELSVSAAVDWLRHLRLPAVLIKAVQGLLSGLEQLSSAPHDEPGVRRLVHYFPAEVDRVVYLARALGVARGEPADEIERFAETLERLRQREGLACLTPPLTGSQVMEVLDIDSGPKVGRALAFLRELTFDRGPLSIREATSALLQWEDER